MTKMKLNQLNVDIFDSLKTSQNKLDIKVKQKMSN